VGQSSSDPSYTGVPYTSYSYESTTTDAIYQISEIKYAASDTISDQQMASGFLNGLLSSLDNQLISSSSATVGTHTALDFQMENDSTGLYTKGRVIIASQSNIVVLFDTYINYDDANYQKFINSFYFN